MIRKGSVYKLRQHGDPGNGMTVLVLSGDQANRETGHIVVAPIVQGRAKLFDGNITRPDVQFRGYVHHVCLDRMRNAPEHILRHGLGSLPYAEMASVEAALCRLLEL